jgi:hypothetical protein
MKASEGAVPGLSSQADVRGCTALSSGSAYLGPRSLDLKRERPPEPCYRRETKTLPSLAKGEKRSRIQQPSTRACIFLPVRVIKG